MHFITASVLLQTDPPSTLDPRGPAAANIAELWWIMFFLGAAIFVLVLALLVYGLFAPRQQTADERSGNRWILAGGIAMPAVVLAVVFGFSIRSAALTASEAGSGAFTIEVIGRRWWWEVNYPEQGVITANEIHIPVGVPVEMLLRSGDVIHSFWVPQLHGKMDLIPGRDNTLIIQADEPGIYRGECAEYCGLQHARMHFMVVAQSAEDFEAWVAGQQQPAVAAAGEAVLHGQQVFIAAGCVYCHTIRGLDSGDVDRSAVDLGPDLTHLASRMTIGAGMVDNNRGNLGGWVVNPHGIKPGVLMPATLLAGEDLQALLDYLGSLE